MAADQLGAARTPMATVMTAQAACGREPSSGLSRGRPPPRRFVFVVEGSADVDLLVRILTPFAIAGAKLAAVEFKTVDDRAIARLQVDGLSHERGEHIHNKLGYAPAITYVGFGWTERCDDRGE